MAMPRIFFAAAVAVALAMTALSAPAAHSQVLVPQAQGDSAVDHMRQATAAAERVTAILLQTVTNPEYASARDADQLSAAIAGMRPGLAAGRSEIRRISAELGALPTISTPSDPPEVRMVDRVVSDISAFTLRIDGFLGVLEDLGDALQAGDEQRTQQLAVSLMKGSVAVVEGQALMLRARLPMMPSDSAGFAQVSTLACFYDGFAALQEGSFDTVKRSVAGAAMSEASACMVVQVASGRQAVEREAVAPQGAPVLEDIRDGLTPVHRTMFATLESGISILNDARDALLAGTDAGTLLRTYGTRTTAFEQRFQTLVSEEVEVVARQGR